MGKILIKNQIGPTIDNSNGTINFNYDPIKAFEMYQKATGGRDYEDLSPAEKESIQALINGESVKSDTPFEPEATGRNTSVTQHQQRVRNQNNQLRIEKLQRVYQEIKALLDVDEIASVLSNDYSVEDVLGIYETILTGVATDQHRVAQGLLQEMLMNDNSKYMSGELNLMCLLNTIGYYRTKGLWTVPPKKLAQTILPKFVDDDLNNARIYIQRGSSAFPPNIENYLDYLM